MGIEFCFFRVFVFLRFCIISAFIALHFHFICASFFYFGDFISVFLLFYVTFLDFSDYARATHKHNQIKHSKNIGIVYEFVCISN